MGQTTKMYISNAIILLRLQGCSIITRLCRIRWKHYCYVYCDFMTNMQWSDILPTSDMFPWDWCLTSGRPSSLKFPQFLLNWWHWRCLPGCQFLSLKQRITEHKTIVSAGNVNFRNYRCSPPNFSTACSTASLICFSSRTSTMQGSAFPPAASTTKHTSSSHCRITWNRAHLAEGKIGLLLSAAAV